MAKACAVIGIGQTRHAAVRDDVSIAGLCREAVDRALADAGAELADMDAVVVGKAPDLFEGVMMPELYLADALGAIGKPLLRVHTAGSVGGATGVWRWVRCSQATSARPYSAASRCAPALIMNVSSVQVRPAR